VEVRLQVGEIDREIYLHRRAAARLLSADHTQRLRFWANVNPDVPHPRWSQQRERDIATGEKIPTHLFNGYAEFVGGLYAGQESEALYL